MSIILLNKLKDKKINNNRDYYFIVINKTEITDVIINSIKGLIKLTSNANNLPFQICWNNNREFKYEHITKKTKLFINCLSNTKPSWEHKFVENIKNL